MKIKGTEIKTVFFLLISRRYFLPEIYIFCQQQISFITLLLIIMLWIIQSAVKERLRDANARIFKITSQMDVLEELIKISWVHSEVKLNACHMP